jgi:predicted metal-dependent peptidase
MPFDLNKHTARLLIKEPFFAALSRKIDKKASTAVPTAGVRVNENGHFEMVYNPEFFEKLTDEERTAVLKHEFYHLIFEHVTGRLPDGGMSKKWNFATDLAINSHIDNLPEGALIPGEGYFAELPKGKSAEWYYENLPEGDKNESENGDGESGEGQGEPGEGGGQNGEGGEGEPQNGAGGNGEPEPFDDHSGWGESNEEADNTANEIAKQRLKESLKEAAQEASKSNGWGSVSQGVRQEIMDRLTSKIDWKKVLRYFIKTSQKANKSSTIKRINRRYAYVHPGRKVNRTAKIAISIDQSGSVDDGMLAQFFAELNKLAKLAEFTVIPFDSEVGEDKIYVWKKGENRKRERVMYGGTCFDAPTKYVNERPFDGHIILTDMCAPKPIASKCQRMWMTTPYYAKHPYFQTNERVIAIDE